MFYVEGLAAFRLTKNTIKIIKPAYNSLRLVIHSYLFFLYRTIFITCMFYKQLIANYSIQILQAWPTIRGQLVPEIKLISDRVNSNRVLSDV